MRCLRVRGKACYSCQDTIEVIRWIMWSPPRFCFFPLHESSQARSPQLSGKLPCDIWLPALRHKVKEKGAAFHGHAEKQRNNAQHPAAAPFLQPGYCQRLRLQPPSGRAPTTGAGGHVGAGASPEGHRAERWGGREQRGFPLDDRVQTLRSETRQESRRCV